MWVPDLQDASLPATQIVIAARSNVRERSPENPNRVAGVCSVVKGDVGEYKEEGVYPEADASSYMYRYEGRGNFFWTGAVIRIVQQPKHGRLELQQKFRPEFSDTYKYFPDKDFYGRDAFVLDVEKGGIKVQVRYRVVVEGDQSQQDVCPGGREFWKISLSATTLDQRG